MTAFDVLRPNAGNVVGQFVHQRARQFARDLIADQIVKPASDALQRELDALPGRGIYRDHKIAVGAEFILQAGALLATYTDRQRAAAAIRRVADAIEDGSIVARACSLGPTEQRELTENQVAQLRLLYQLGATSRAGGLSTQDTRELSAPVMGKLATYSLVDCDRADRPAGAVTVWWLTLAGVAIAREAEHA